MRMSSLREWEIDAALEAIESLFRSSEGMAYLGEEVSMIEHQLQAGRLAMAADMPDALAVAVLLHDVGHMVGQQTGEDDATSALSAGQDAHHDSSGALWLTQWFGPDVTEPVRLHVAAKRYLVATEPAYASVLSTASVRTLHLQGGPMSAIEIHEFARHPAAAGAVTLRRFDEQAKDAAVNAPTLVEHRDLIARVLRQR
jgi:gamma-butyrobetaine dioxygenase